MTQEDSKSVDRPLPELGAKRFVRALALVLLFVVAQASWGCEKKPDSATPAPSAANTPAAVEQAAPSMEPAQSGGEALTVVSDRSLVCMVNNQFMGKPQIPVAVEGKTYYGCCPMCKERLAKNADVRTAIDPVSQKAVDKAEAVMAKTASGDILYFENNASLAAYSNRKSR